MLQGWLNSSKMQNKKKYLLFWADKRVKLKLSVNNNYYQFSQNFRQPHSNKWCTAQHHFVLRDVPARFLSNKSRQLGTAKCSIPWHTCSSQVGGDLISASRVEDVCVVVRILVWWGRRVFLSAHHGRFGKGGHVDLYTGMIGAEWIQTKLDS